MLVLRSRNVVRLVRDGPAQSIHTRAVAIRAYGGRINCFILVLGPILAYYAHETFAGGLLSLYFRPKSSKWYLVRHAVSRLQGLQEGKRERRSLLLKLALVVKRPKISVQIVKAERRREHSWLTRLRVLCWVLNSQRSRVSQFGLEKARAVKRSMVRTMAE